MAVSGFQPRRFRRCEIPTSPSMRINAFAANVDAETEAEFGEHLQSPTSLARVGVDAADRDRQFRVRDARAEGGRLTQS